MKGRPPEQADIADAVSTDHGEIRARELGVPPSGDKGSLPTFKGRSATSEEVSEELRKQYALDERKRREEGVQQGFKELKHRSRARKYLAQVMQRKLETHVDNLLWDETHDLDINNEHILRLEREYKESGKSLLREAERVVFALEHERIKEAKREATRLLERNVPVRLKKRLLAGTIFLLSVVFLVSISALSRITGNPLRARIDTWLRLDETDSFAKWLACDDPFGIFMDFTGGSSATSLCKSDDNVENIYLYNLTNAEQVRVSGAAPIVREVGPFPFARRVRKLRVANTSTSVTVNRVPYFEYLGEDGSLDVELTLPNVGYFMLVAFLEKGVGLTDSDALLFPWLAAQRIQAKIREFPDTTADTWMTEANATDCWTFGCFLYQNKFTALVAAEPNATERANRIAQNLEGLPVFGDIAFSSTQEQMLWSLLQNVTTFAAATAQGDPACAFDLESFCETVGATVSNAKLIVDDFLSLWTISGSLAILSSLDRVRLASGIESGFLDAFYEGLSLRTSVCRTETANLGTFTCTQLNDIAQYLYWLFSAEWESLASRRKSSKGPFVTRTAREFLITGYADTSLALRNGVMRTMPDVLNQPDSRSDFPAGLFRGDYPADVLSDSDLAWLSHAWVPGIVQGVPNETLTAFLSATVDSSDQARVIPGSWILAPDTYADSEALSLQSRVYLVGTSTPEYLQAARFMQAIDGQITARLFGETTSVQGRDQWLQFAPTLDMLWTDTRLDVDGFPYAENALLSAWQDEIQVWIDDVWRPVTFQQRAVLSSFNGTSIDALRFALKYDRLKRFELDRTSDLTTTCMVNVGPKREYLPLWIGYPSYLTCNSTNGVATPSTRDEEEDTSQDDITYDDLVSQDDESVDDYDIDYDVFPQAEVPLPLDERAEVLGISSRLASNESMNTIVLEPISGATLGYSIDLGMYIQLQAMVSMLPLAPSVKLPFYASTRERHMPAAQREALATAVTRSARQMRAVSWIGAITAVSCLVLSLLILFRNRGTPELKVAQVRPVESLETEADEKRKELQRQERERLKDLKRKHQQARERYEEAHQKLTSQYARNFDTLFRVDTTPQHDGKARLIKRQKNAAKIEATYGIARDGDVFMFTNAEMKTLAEQYGNPLEHLIRPEDIPQSTIDSRKLSAVSELG
ncbi:Sensory neuron membrane protein 1 [Hondaea fermentalgiana]|uniref:Sensory neuron membrane protein 1 n=1 Tax=Hondaea fermentalgiana TaxID=2315210 RepID=A0A2R5G089_9STRA|nr:Sensory neuron membrane protein 1 [Hondaea fermentalgiana]|eukprot:GBG23935.1 Sensory neuron membrane protein 1 [Hondaea fermentalgiana]